MSAGSRPVISAASSSDVRFAWSASSKPLVDASMNSLIDPALIRDVGEQRVEQREVGARVDREVQHTLLAQLRLAGVDGHRPPRVDDHDPARRMRLLRHLGLLLVHRDAAHVRDPVVEEVVGLGLEGVGADGDDGVRELGILVGSC